MSHSSVIKSDRLNSVKNNPSKKKQKYLLISSMATLLAACGSEAQNVLKSIGDVTGSVTNAADKITLGAKGEAGTVDLGGGDDTVVGGAKVDFIRGGAGADNIKGGAGRDNLVMIGTTKNAGYQLSDLTNPNGTGIDLSALVSLDDLNNNAVSDASSGEVIDGGADGAVLFVYGEVDFTGITLINITIIDVHSEITVPATLLKSLIDGGVFQQIHGDGSTELIITHEGADLTLDLSAISMKDIAEITVPKGVTLKLDQADLEGTKQIEGEGIIQAVSNLLDLDGLTVSGKITILDQNGNEVLPNFAGDKSVNIAENSVNVGTFAVTDESAVGEVTYKLSGADASLFNIDSKTGAVTFKTAPDFENAQDQGADNQYDIIVTATDTRGKSATENIEVNVTNVNDIAMTSAATANMPEVGASTILDVNANQDATFSIVGGAAQADFAIDANSGVITYTGATQDFDTLGAKKYELIVRASSKNGADSVDQNVTITLSNVNENTINTPHNISVEENRPDFVADFDTATALDRFTIVGGADQDKFILVEGSGELSFVDSPDFENPHDADGDNVYELTIQANSFANGDKSTANIQVTVTDVNDDPKFEKSLLNSINLKENQLNIGTFTATDDEDGSNVTYGKLSGGDAALFNVDQNTGAVTFINAPDFENPTDSGQDNVYNVTIIAEDSNQGSTQHALTITVEDVNEPTLELAGQLVKSGKEFLVNTRTDDQQRNPDIVELSNGKYVIVWEDFFAPGDNSNFGIKGQMFNENGTKFGDEFLVNTQTNLTQDSPKVIALHDGEFAVGWHSLDGVEDTVSFGVKMQIFNADGSKKGSETLVNVDTSGSEQDVDMVGLSNGNFVMVWERGVDSFIRLFDKDGTALTPEIQVEKIASGGVGDLAVEALNNGGFILTWTNNGGFDNQAGVGIGDIEARIYDQNAAPVGDVFAVNDLTHGFQYEPVVSVFENNDFVIAWKTVEGGSNKIKMQLFAADKSEQTAELEVPTNSSMAASSMDIAVLEDGNFLLSWRHGNTEVLGQIFDKSGSPQGDRFTVNSLTTATQDEVAVTALKSGGFLNVWRTDDATQDGTSSAIKAQKFDYSPIHKFHGPESFDLTILAENHVANPNNVLSDITISNIPAGITFNNGTVNQDGSLTLTHADLSGLQMSVTDSVNLRSELVLTMASTTQNGDQVIQTTKVPISIGNYDANASNANSMTATAQIDHFDGGIGTQTLNITGSKSDYSFDIVGNDLQISQNGNAANIDLIHAIEMLNFADDGGAIDVDTLANDISAVNQDEFNVWLHQQYGHDFE